MPPTLFLPAELVASLAEADPPRATEQAPFYWIHDDRYTMYQHKLVARRETLRREDAARTVDQVSSSEQ